MTTAIMQDDPYGDIDSGAGEQQQEDYFSFTKEEDFLLPDGISFVRIHSLNEGERAKFQSRTQPDMEFERGGKSSMKIDQAKQRHELLRQGITNWNLKRNGQFVPFKPMTLSDFLTLSNPVVVDKIEAAIRRLNPWLLTEQSSDDLKAQIDELNEAYEKALEREQGEASSSVR